MKRRFLRFGLPAMAVGVVFLGLALAAGASFAGTFSDDEGSLHEANIEAIAAAGITDGCVAGTTWFCPDDGVTRAQMASFMARALELTDAAPDAFTDDEGSVHEANINRLAALGVTQGCTETLYCPDEIVSRQQMASFLARALDDLAPPRDDYFIDDEGSVHEEAINTIRENAITLGCNEAGNFFCPLDAVSRGQMASLLARGFGLDPIIPEPPADSDPAFYTTPPVLGTGARTIVVPTSGSPTLQEAFDGALPGDSIVLAAGTHLFAGQGNQVLRRSGTATSWIEIRGADGARPIVDLQGAGELRISASHVVLEHLEIRSGAGNNLHIAPEGSDISNIIVRDVEISGLNAGPGAAVKINRSNPAGVSDVYIERCDVSGSLDNAVIDGVGVERAVVRDCWIHDNEIGSHGIFFKGGSTDILIEGNLISGIRGNAALQLGGDTAPEFWNPAQPLWEGVNQVARNNLIADFDDSGVEIRGVQGGRVYHNTIVTQTTFTIFRLQTGGNATGGLSDNGDISIVNNLVIGTGGNPQYARNDGSSVDVAFGHQLWGGLFRNSGTPTPGIPVFPAGGDVVVGESGLPFVLVDPTVGNIDGRANAIARYRPISGSIALSAGQGTALVSRDILGVLRSETSPSIGAFETP